MIRVIFMIDMLFYVEPLNDIYLMNISNHWSSRLTFIYILNWGESAVDYSGICC